VLRREGDGYLMEVLRNRTFLPTRSLNGRILHLNETVPVRVVDHDRRWRDVVVEPIRRRAKQIEEEPTDPPAGDNSDTRW
jgi:hypothetical protein